MRHNTDLPTISFSDAIQVRGLRFHISLVIFGRTFILIKSLFLCLLSAK